MGQAMTGLPFDDEERVAALRRLDLLDTEPEAEFDAVTDLAVTLTGASMAAISLLRKLWPV